MSEHSSLGGPAEGAVDRAIDRAVRQIMSAEPPPGLRRRVMARLEAPAPRPSLVPRVALAAAALAAVVLAVILLRPSPPAVLDTVRTDAEPATRTVTAPPAPAAEIRPPARAAVDAPPRRTLTREAIPMPRIANVFGARAARAEAAAAAVDDVVFSQEDTVPRAADLPGMPPPITVSRIAIAPLEVERLRVDQLPTRK
jgi:hypothetical protein